ncbi:MAG: 5,6-dimethylbenzimidazole synthase, partial [Gemmatimonadota bacterium]|nr:5,6-dimethylbenzimidazole synthase [Gemmatimonadota bacterium]
MHPSDGRFGDAARRAVYDVIARRRDIRNFRPDPLPDATLLRILDAAHRAGSVGLMQPWDFVLVRSPALRERVYELFRRADERAAERFRDDRRATYGALKLQGILDAPLSVCVTCDTRRGGPHVLGRDTIPETDVYSTCLAVQNFWLAARAEGVGVGWVSIVDPAELAAALGLPDGVIPVAFLCVGFPVEWARTPMLEATGWRTRAPLAERVHFDGWGETGAEAPLRRLLDVSAKSRAPGEPASEEPLCLPRLIACVGVPDPGGERAERVRARLDSLAKPPGSLGQLEALAVRLAGIAGDDTPTAEQKRVLVFAADHGVCAEGVSAYHPGVTVRLCYNFIAGGGVVNALARGVGAQVTVVDVGVDHDFAGASGIVHRKVRRGTRNLAQVDAMSRDEAEQALFAGAAAVRELDRCDVLALGEVGIGNTTAASALLALLTGASAGETVGGGTGIG